MTGDGGPAAAADGAGPGALALLERRDGFVRYRWALAISPAEDKVCSDQFELGGALWRIVVFPRGNAVQSLSVYLDIANVHQLPEGWVQTAAFTFRVVNAQDSSRSVVQRAKKQFSSGTSDWGFQEFMPLSQLFRPDSGFVVFDQLTLEAEVRLKSDPTSPLEPPRAVVPPPPPSPPRNDTGFVGIKNQGATCYLNSLLQTYYHLSYLRHAVYCLPISSSSANSIPAALQRVFYELQYGHTAVDTQELTRSFGWDSSEAFRQHDVHELNRVLCDTLERKMKMTEVAGTMELLFKGVTTNVIQCLDISFESRTKESFYDLQLNVKGCSGVKDAFRQYVAVEVLDGSNKYLAEGQGLQAAKKFIQLTALPNVLILHLKRFEYNAQTGALQKVNDRYEFPTTLDLDEFVAGTPGEDGQTFSYALFSVLVHAGGVHGGHYYAFIRPDHQDSWYRFDDERVTRVTEQDAVAENYGGPVAPGGGAASSLRSANAYVLVYIRQCTLSRILFPISDVDIPSAVHARFANEKRHQEELRRDAAEAQVYLLVKLTSPDMILRHGGPDLLDFATVPTVKVRRLEPYSKFKKHVEELLRIPAGEQHFWRWEARLSGAWRPSSPVPAPPHESTAIEKALAIAPKAAEPVRLFVHGLADSRALGRAASIVSSITLTNEDGGSVLLFLKLYDAASSRLRVLSWHRVRRSMPLVELFPVVARARPDHSPLNQFEVYEEVRPGMFDRLDPSLTVEHAELGHGDILVFQSTEAEDPAGDSGNFDATRHLQRRPRYATVPAYGSSLVLPSRVKFCHLAHPNKVVCTLDLTLDMPLVEVRHRLAAFLELDAACLQLSGQSTHNQPRQCPLREDGAVLGREARLHDALAVCWDRLTPVLYYEVLPAPPPAATVTLHVDWYTTQHVKQHTYRLTLGRDSLVKDLLHHLAHAYLVTDAKLIVAPPPPPAPSTLGWPPNRIQAPLPSIPAPPEDEDSPGAAVHPSSPPSSVDDAPAPLRPPIQPPRQPLRLLEVSARLHRIVTVFPPLEPLTLLEDHPHFSLRAEVVPLAQVDAVPLGAGGRLDSASSAAAKQPGRRDGRDGHRRWLIQVVHCSLQRGRMVTHGTPFLTHITSGETAPSLRKRLVEENEQVREIREAWGLYLLHSGDQFVRLIDDSKLLPKLLAVTTPAAEACLGIEHAEAEKASRPTRGPSSRGVLILG
eukprot:EG_transcript_622